MFSQDKAKKVAEKLRHNVVEVEVEGHKENGWGFLVGCDKNDCYIITPNHVVREDDEEKKDSKINIRFEKQGFPTQAYYTDYWISEKKQDLAVLTVRLPSTYRYKRATFACTKYSPTGEKVWYVGRDGERDILGPGKIISYSNNDKIMISGFIDAVERTSGAAIVSKEGFEGFLLGPSDDRKNIEALSLAYVEEKLKYWEVPYDGDNWKNSTYCFLASSVISIGVGLTYFRNEKNENYNIYSNNLDLTAPVYAGKSRDDVYNEAKKFQSLEISFYVLSGMFACLAYLVNNKCLFHKNKNRAPDLNAGFAPSDGRHLTSAKTEIGIKWDF